ncbi:MAG: hypothetical protein RLZZ175_896, partial [Bacteroidota bacterium]
PVITTQPAAQSVCQTETATFGVTMASSPASTVVKWQKVTTAADTSNATKYVDIANTTTSLSLTNVPFTDNGAWYRVVTASTPSTCILNSKWVQLTVKPTPATPTISGTLTLCVGNNLALTAATTTTGTATWIWTKPSGSTAAQGSGASSNQMNKTGVALTEAGDYTAQVVIAGCSSAVSTASKVVITAAPVATVSASQTICSGKAMAATLVTLNPTTATYDWRGKDTTIAPATAVVTNPTPNPTSGTGVAHNTDRAQTGLSVPVGTVSGSYVYYITPKSGSCVGTTVRHIVTVNPTPTTPAPTNTGPYCVGKQIDLDANVATTLVDASNGYAWTGPAGFTANSKTPTIASAALTPTSNAGVYSVTVTKNGCTSAAGTTTVVVNDIPTAPVPTAVSVCKNATSPIITVTPNTALKWYADNTTTTSSATQPTISTATVGTQSLYVTTTVNGCESARAKADITINDLPVFTATAAQATICKGTNAVINLSSGAATYTYTWTTTGTNVTGNSAQATDQSVTNITQNLGLSNVNNAGTVQYIITAKGTGNCTSNQTVDIAVDPCPYTPDFTPSKTAVCLDATTGLATITLTNASSGNVNNWTWDLGGESATTLAAKTGTGLTALNNPSTFTVTYNTAGTKTIKLEIDGVGATQKVSKVVTIEVGAVPAITVSGNNPICGDTTTAITLNTTNVASNFTWVVKSQTDVTGATANATAQLSPATLAQKLTNTSTANPKVAGTAVYTVTATGPTPTSCTASQDVTVTVNPLPDVVGTGVTVCGSATSQSLVTGISANVPSSTIAWTSTLNGVTLSPTSGNVTGTTIDGTTNTTGATQGTIDFVLTATANGCVGPNKTITSTINPLPSVIGTAAVGGICSGTSNADVITGITSNITGNVNWTAAVGTGTVTGFTTSGTLAVSSTATKLTNAGAITGTGTIVYTFTPSSGSGCPGQPTTITVAINATPTLSPITQPGQLCSSTSPSTVFTTDVPAKIVWLPVGIVPSTIKMLKGGTGPAVTVAGDSALNTTSATLSDKFISTLATNNVQTLQYTVQASNGACKSATQTLTITIDSCELKADFDFDKGSVCEGATTAVITFTDKSTSASPITSYAWDFGDTPAQTATTAGPHTITYASSGTKTISLTVTATIAGNVKTNTITKTITVNPLPNITNTTKAFTICDSTATNIAITSDQASTTYAWTVSTTGGVQNAVAGTGALIAQTLKLPALQTTNGTVKYTVTPTLNNCPGATADFDVTVEPRPVIATLQDVSVCSNVALSLNVQANIATSPISWTRAAVGSIPSATGNSGVVTDVLTNRGTSPVTVKYTFTPTGPGTQACVGKPTNLNVIVAPLPTVNSTLTNQKVCSGIQYSHTITSPVAGTTFTWSRAANTNITNGAVTAQNTNPISEVLNLASGVTTGQQATYTITPTGPAPSNCLGRDTTLVLTVNPLPTITASTGTVCSGVAYSYTVTTQLPSSAIAGFTWVRQANGSITPAATGTTQTTNPLAETLTNTSLTPQLVTYALNAKTIEGCTNPSTTNHVLTVNPLPVATLITQKAQICIGDSTRLQITLQGATTYNVIYSDGGVQQNLNSVTVSPQLITIKPTTTTQYSLVKVEDDATKCLANLSNVSPQTLKVNSLPTVSLSGNSQICEGGSSTVDFTIAGAASPYKLTFQEKNMKTNVTQTSSINNISTNAYQITVAPIDTTVYKTVSLVDNNGCKAVMTSTDSAEVDVVPTPVLSTVIGVGKDTVCDGQATLITLTANPYTTFSWTAKASSKVSGASSGTGSIIQQTLKTTATVKGNVRYTITPMNYSCPGTPKDVVVFVRPKTIPNIGADRSGICKGTKVKLTAGKFNTQGGQYTWTLYGASTVKTYENRDTLEIELNEDTEIEVNYKDVCNIDNIDTAMYKIIEQVDINFIKGDTCAEYVTTFKPENISATGNSTNVTNWKWNFGDSKDTTVTDRVIKDATHAYADAGEYNVHLSALSDQCPVGDTTIKVTIIDCSIRTKTAFTPGGGNGQNDTWRIDGIENYPNASVEIFNRWGVLVHRQLNGYKEPWNGTNTSGELLEDGTYYYVITLNKSKKIVKGYVSIFRDNAQ